MKKCMNNALSKMSNGSTSPIPTDSNIFSYIPSKENFVDYASLIIKSNFPVKEISRVMVSGLIDEYSKNSRPKRRITLDSDDEDESDNSRVTRSGRIRSRKTPVNQRPSKKKKARKGNSPRNTRNPLNSRTTRSSPCPIETPSEPEVSILPEDQEDEDDMITEPDEMEYQACESHEAPEEPEVSPPDPITNYDHLPSPLQPTDSGSMTVVSREYFPESEFVFPGIYILPNDSGYVLFCVDNGRYSNSWKHEDGVTNLTWMTASKDKSRSALRAIANSGNVHVFRKISGEPTFRYMGRVFMSDNINQSLGTVDLSVY